MGKYSDGCPDSGHTRDSGCENSMQGHGYNPRTENEQPDSGVSSDSCFPYDALIDTPYGKVKIGELKKGQLVLSFANGKLEPRVITHKRVRGVAQIIRVEFKDSTALRATGHHTFLTQRGWKKMEQIVPGDFIAQSNSSFKSVKSITIQGREPVFNIYTAGEHTFIAEGCIAHNFTEFRMLRTLLHQMFLDPISQPLLETVTKACSQE